MRTQGANGRAIHQAHFNECRAVKEVDKNHPLPYKQSIDVYGYTVHTGMMKSITTMTMKNPPHPGDLIRTEIIDALGLSVSKAADILKVRRATLSDLLAGKAALSPEMAIRIEKAFRP